MTALVKTDNTVLRVLLWLVGLAVLGIVVNWFFTTIVVNLQEFEIIELQEGDLLYSHTEVWAHRIFRWNTIFLVTSGLLAFLVWYYME